MDLTQKSESLAAKMNKLTEKLTENLDVADEMILVGDDVVDFVEQKTQNIELYSEDLPVAEIISLNNMVADFKYVRETLRENTDNGRRVLNSITLSLLDSDDDKRASLIMSFAELNRAVADNMKLYIQSYKEISNVLLNLDKIKKSEAQDSPTSVTNNLTINSTEAISTVDLIKQLTGNNNGPI
jgi:hypothetical protein